jgi:hypothetical protein
MALEPNRDEEIRKSAVVSLSFVAGRAAERGAYLNSPESVNALIQLSTDPLPVLRQSAAFGLGLFDSPDATHQLQVLLASGDQMTQVNAAIGLARHGSTEGFTVFRDALKLPEPVPPVAPTAGDDKRQTASDDQFLVVKNVLKAANDLAPKFTAEQRSELVPRLEVLSQKHPEMLIRVHAEKALNALKAEEKLSKSH